MENIEPVDITGYLPEDTATLNLLIPGTEKLSGWIVTFAGPAHPKSVAVSRETSRRIALRNDRKEAAQVNGRKWKPESQPVEDRTREFVSDVVSRIVTWTPVKIGDEVFPFDEKTAVDLLMRPQMGSYFAQMFDFLADEKSFMKTSAPK